MMDCQFYFGTGFLFYIGIISAGMRKLDYAEFICYFMNRQKDNKNPFWRKEIPGVIPPRIFFFF